MSLHVVPPKSHATLSTTPLPAPSAPGVHDTLRANALGQDQLPQPTSSKQPSEPQEPFQSTHPLEPRLRNWQSNAQDLQMQTQRHHMGLAQPVWRGIEMQAVRTNEWRPVVLGGSGKGGVHSDVLAGRDWECGWEDVFGAGREFKQLPDFHSEMEARMRMNW